ncbi:ASKHA domain-containing protein, partial [uncultured Desulfovibrio sp.]
CSACAAVGPGTQPEPAARARGISATGYLSLLAVLLRAGLLQSDGRLDPAPAMPLTRRLAAGLEHGRLRLPHGLWLDAGDVEELLKVKAAFALALEALLRAADLPVAGVARLCLAGSLGAHVCLEDLETLGFLPAGLARRTEAVGNTALEGAALLARCPERGAAVARLCCKAHVLALTQQPDFAHDYLRQMRFGG